MKGGKRSARVLGVSLLVLVLRSANASLLIEQQTEPFHIAPLELTNFTDGTVVGPIQTHPMTFTQFDTRKGTLMTVMIGLSDSPLSGDLFVGAVGPPAIGSAVLSAETEVLTPVGTTLGALDTFFFSAACGSFTPECTAGPNPFSALRDDAVLLTALADLAVFEGMGTLDMTAALSTSLMNATVTGVGPISVSSRANIGWKGDVTVKYVFSAGVMSEPATIALVGLGVAGLGIARQRDRSAA